MGFGLVPREPKQAVRVRRFLLGAASTLLFVAFVALAWALDLVAGAAALRAGALALGFVVLFYLWLRSGWNQRLDDPSLTLPMCLAAMFTVAWLVHEAQALRALAVVFYLVAMLFGVFRLPAGQLLALAGFGVVAHAAAIGLAALRRGAPPPPLELLGLALVAALLPWFAWIGGRVNRLRLRLADSNRRLTEALARIERIAIHDELTGVYNRRYLMETLAREIARVARSQRPLAICLFDLDHFKDVNDTWGHAAGDAVLRRFAEIARAELRASDVFGRQGGEEFLLVLPDTTLGGALALAERVRSAVAHERFPLLPAERRVTVTAGVAARADGEDLDALLARADRALYHGKQTGRNRVVAAG